jgi:carbamoyltransferase
MKILGIAEGSHDASWTLIEDGEILDAHHAERFFRIKNYKWLYPGNIPTRKADVVVGHENKERVNQRRKKAGQDLLEAGIPVDVSYNHYETHAWAGWSTSPFDDCDILCVDAIGESETAAVFKVRNKVFTKTWEMKYPQSIGLAYSAVTHALGYKPMEEEYIVMGLAAYGEPIVDFDYLLDTNCHKGIHLPKGSAQDIAASIQVFYERQLLKLIDTYCKHDNLILMGGCALNCVANSKIEGKNIWIMPNPGDAGSSLGAAARHYGKKLNWKGPYLGTNILNDFNPYKIVRHLSEHGVCGFALGRAEFGPRALGNRSLLADPRRPINNTVNEIKQRQKFRPFGPAILEEFYDDYYEGPVSEYMQFVSKAKHDMTSVIHVDGTSRVQLVKDTCESHIRKILEIWYEKTGCPMLLNTSLNIKGQPMVDTREDADEFERKYNVKVF